MNYSNAAELLSVIAAIIYYYKKTRDRVVVWVLGYLSFLIFAAVIFRKLYPDIPFVSPTLEYMVFLSIVGIPFLVLVVMLGVEYEKPKTKLPDEYEKNRSAIFSLTRGNLIFWSIIVLINVVAFLLGGGR